MLLPATKTLHTKSQAPPTPKPGPSQTDNTDKSTRKKRQAPQPKQVPIAKQPVVSMATPDVGEERLEHMKKMKELKTLLPDLEMEYYRNLVGRIVSVHEQN